MEFSHDSLNEGRVAELLSQAGLSFTTQVPMPVTDWPWKTPRSRGAPKCDLLLTDSGIYVEVKGWMTLYGLAKSAWLCAQEFPYFFFQNDDDSWEPFIDSPCPRAVDRGSSAALLRSSVQQQMDELLLFASTPERRRQANTLSRGRIKRHIEQRMRLYESWVGEFP